MVRADSVEKTKAHQLSMKKFVTLAAAAVVAGFASPASVLACAACFGKSDSNMARSLNAGIFSLMGVIVTVLVGAASFFVFVSRRAAASAEAEEAGKSPAKNQLE
jgi:heme/copper-type cytochrome/quinol oxidase subunit 2